MVFFKKLSFVKKNDKLIIMPSASGYDKENGAEIDAANNTLVYL
jgi:hypothetical protein